jgi:predicted transposase YdaD
LRQAFETWLKKVVLPRLGLSQEEVSATETLEEVDTMLAEKIDRWNRELWERALHEGRQEGREEGRQEGEARILLQLLRLKFGTLEPEIEEQVRSADSDRLLEWSRRILNAESLRDVFRG